MPVWRLWREWGIADAQMIGWWDEACPVTTSDPKVKATAYVKDHALLIALGNFGKNESLVTLTLTGTLAPKVKGGWTARAIEGYQPARTFALGEAIPVAGKRGWLLEAQLQSL